MLLQFIENQIMTTDSLVQEEDTRRTLAAVDPQIADAIRKERRRQFENIELIASENFTSKAVMEAQGSCLTNKYAEGYPGRRWYGWMRKHGRSRITGYPARKEPLFRRARQCAAPQWQPGKHGGLLHRPYAWRPHSDDGPCPREDTSHTGIRRTFRKTLRDSSLRRGSRIRADRLRRACAAS